MANYGFVYVLSNPAMPGIFKVGYTDRSPLQRADELSGSTACPIPFDVVCYGEVRDAQMVEQDIHQLYADLRISPNREFFRMDVDRLIREFCINLRELCINFCECEQYDTFEYELRLAGENATAVIKEASK